MNLKWRTCWRNDEFRRGGPSIFGEIGSSIRAQTALLIGICFLILFTFPSISAGQARNSNAALRPDANFASTSLKPTKASSPHPAHIEAYERTEIHAKVSGYLQLFGTVKDSSGTECPVDIGDRVAEGQILAIISVPELDQDVRQKQAMVDQALAELEQANAAQVAAGAMVDAAAAKVDEVHALTAQAQAELEFRQSEHQRYAALVRDRAVRQELEDEKRLQLQSAEAAIQSVQASLGTSKANLRVKEAERIKADADIASAAARVKVAQSNLKMCQITLDYATIKSPYAATITNRYVDTGDFVQSAESGNPEPLFTLMRCDRLRVIAEVPESEAALIHVGQTVNFQAKAAVTEEPVQGRVVRFADALDPSTRTMRVESELNETSLSLRPGMFGSITIEHSEPAPRVTSSDKSR